MDDKVRMQIIADNITFYRKQKGITQKELSQAIGITASTMTDYMKLRSAPSFGVIQKIADYFEVKKSDIDSTFKDEEVIINSIPKSVSKLNAELNKENHTKWVDYGNELLEEQITVQEESVEYNSDKVIPLYKQYEEDEYEEVLIYGEPSAGRGTWLSDESIESIMYPKPVPDHDIALRVRGNSMEPLFQDGEIVFVRKTKNVNNGQIIIIIVNNEAYIKKLYKRSNEVRLVSLNPDYGDIVLTEYDDVEVVGTVIL